MPGFVQGTGVQSVGSVDTVSKGFTSDVTAGNLLVAAVVTSVAVIPDGAVTDTAGHTWEVGIFRQRSAGIPGETVAIFSTVCQTTGPLTVTFDATGSDYQSLGIGEFSPTTDYAWGLNLGTRLDGVGGNDNAGTPSHPAVTGDITNGLFGVTIAALSNASASGATDMTVQGSFVAFYEVENVTNMPLSAAYQFTGPGTISASWTLGGPPSDVQWTCVISGFYEGLANPDPDLHYGAKVFPKNVLRDNKDKDEEDFVRSQL